MGGTSMQSKITKLQGLQKVVISIDIRMTGTLYPHDPRHHQCEGLYTLIINMVRFTHIASFRKNGRNFSQLQLPIIHISQLQSFVLSIHNDRQLSQFTDILFKTDLSHHVPNLFLHHYTPRLSSQR